MEKYTVTIGEFAEFEQFQEQLESLAGHKLYRELWVREDGVIHRANGPALRVWVENPDFTLSPDAELWIEDGLLHRAISPAVVICEPNYSANIKQFYQNGKLHRADGPAIIVDGGRWGKVENRYFLNGEELPQGARLPEGPMGTRTAGPRDPSI